MMPFAFLGTFGPWEMAIVGLVCLLIFGNRLPSVMRSLGQGVTEFKKGISGVAGRNRAGSDRRQEAQPAKYMINVARVV